MAGLFLWEVLAASCIEELPSFHLKQSLSSRDIFPYISANEVHTKQATIRSISVNGHYATLTLAG